MDQGSGEKRGKWIDGRGQMGSTHSWGSGCLGDILRRIGSCSIGVEGFRRIWISVMTWFTVTMGWVFEVKGGNEGYWNWNFLYSYGYFYCWCCLSINYWVRYVENFQLWSQHCQFFLKVLSIFGIYMSILSLLLGVHFHIVLVNETFYYGVTVVR